MAYDNVLRIKAFCEIDYHQYIDQRRLNIKAAIERRGKEYILGVDENEFKTYLFEEYSFEPLVIDSNSAEVGEPTISKETMESRFYSERYNVDVYTFTVYYRFTGSAELFNVKPTTWRMDSTEIFVNQTRNTVSFSFKLYKRDPEAFNDAKNSLYSSAFSNVTNINNDIKNWNNGLEGTINSIFNAQKTKYQEENNFFAAINVKINKDTSSIFTSPTVKKRIIPQPTVAKNKEFSSEPTMSKEMYEDILKVVYDSGKNMEKKPALYIGKDEEGLRDQFLFVLETRYEGTTATGETFNRSGKTDIILKYAKDASNLFVAECKFWHGSSEYLKAISQLFDKYLTWRDSKVALILFVTNLDFTNVLLSISSEIKTHPNFIREQGKRGETSFSFIMNLPQDKAKEIFLEVLAFHYDKK